MQTHGRTMTRFLTSLKEVEAYMGKEGAVEEGKGGKVF